jgi:outer membrane protein TolC
MQSAVEAMQAQLEQLKPEEYAKTMELMNRQIESVIRQVVAGGQSLYLSLLRAEAGREDLQRGLATLERSLEEVTLRHELGQVSDLTLDQLQSTYQTTKQQGDALDLTISTLQANLLQLVGQDPGGKLTAAPVPSVTDAQKKVYQTDYAQALAQGKEASFSLYQAQRTFEDAEKAWKDLKAFVGSENYQRGLQTYNAAVYTRDAAVKSFELSFRAAYQGVEDARIALDSARTSLAAEEKNYQSAALRHQLGQLSDTALQSAQDAVYTAQSKVKAAEINHFAAYESYVRAVQWGVV